MNDPHPDHDLEERDDSEAIPGREADNDQDSHVSPPDNDGETVPQDEVADQAGG